MRAWQIAVGAAVAIAAGAVYALDSGIYVGSKFYIRGATCCPSDDEVVKYCKYLFITGISEMQAGNGIRTVPGARKRNEDLAVGIWSEPKPEPLDQGFCRIFGSGQASAQFLTR